MITLEPYGIYLYEDTWDKALGIIHILEYINEWGPGTKTQGQYSYRILYSTNDTNIDKTRIRYINSASHSFIIKKLDTTPETYLQDYPELFI